VSNEGTTDQDLSGVCLNFEPGFSCASGPLREADGRRITDDACRDAGLRISDAAAGYPEIDADRAMEL